MGLSFPMDTQRVMVSYIRDRDALGQPSGLSGLPRSARPTNCPCHPFVRFRALEPALDYTSYQAKEEATEEYDLQHSEPLAPARSVLLGSLIGAVSWIA